VHVSGQVQKAVFSGLNQNPVVRL